MENAIPGAEQPQLPGATKQRRTRSRSKTKRTTANRAAPVAGVSGGGGMQPGTKTPGKSSTTGSRSRSNSKRPMQQGSARREGGAAVMLSGTGAPAADHSGLFANDILRNGGQMTGGSFQFQARPWDPGTESWEKYEARVLSQMQEAFTGYSRYVRTLVKASSPESSSITH